ncbi:cytoplasmic dynein heavy chain [Drechslerella stenobrocha 248]|uniref:Dynein heavy chain, cytoplasmic n=1 Tax=Drechslerella stenobrocha 248 TaxID=1043628 RepID=W7HQE8_9PEZI|nr:cytoplasmic dynein heavy chain [Drechslerella stenobrocha 248]
MDALAPRGSDRRSPSPGPSSSSPSTSTTNPVNMLEHLVQVIDVTLGASKRELEATGSLLSRSHYSDTLLRCSRFSSEGPTVLYICKDLVETPADPASEAIDGSATPQYRYSVASELSTSPLTVTTVALIKRPAALEATIPLAAQLQILNLPGNSPYEILHSVMHHALVPYFDAYVKANQSQSGKSASQSAASSRYAENESKSGIPAAKKKMAELELAFLHLQQNIEIPELSLVMHPTIQAAIEEAVSKGQKPARDMIPSTIVNDTMFLNQLQATVNSWIKSIQTITKMQRDADSGSATQEINFWLNMESALEGIEEQLRGDGVVLTLEILRYAKRFHATVSFIADTGLKEASDTVQKYNQLMRDFPLDELLSATSLAKVQEALVKIFSHINKKLRITSYPIRRALPLAEAISGDLDDRLHELLSGRRLMHMEYRDFEALMNVADSIFSTWDENVKEFTNTAREVTRKRAEKFIPIKITKRHNKTQERLTYVRAFRHGHEQLQRTIQNVLGPGDGEVRGETGGQGTVEDIGDVDAVEEVASAYAVLKDVDVLDVSIEGTDIWITAENAYNERTSRVENSIIARLRDRLATAKNATEMFRVFSKFNALFVRPKIRGAIQEYQTQLIDNVKADIAALHERFKQQYGHSEAHAMAQMHDLPPIAGAIIWAHQIERQLNAYLKRVEDILGQGWENYAEGQKLYSESNSFKAKLETRPIYEAWLADVQRRNVSISGRLFNIHRNRALGNQLELVVNFDPQVIALFKEVRNLVNLKFTVPHAINSVSKEAKRVYPYAVSLMESVRTLAQTNKIILDMSDVSTLLSGYHDAVHVLIAKGMPLKWESFVHSYDLHVRNVVTYLPNGNMDTGTSLAGRESRHVQFVRDIATAVGILQMKTQTLNTINENIRKALTELKSCPYETEPLRTRLESIQTAVDQLNLENFVNLPQWVGALNSQIQDILLGRLEEATNTWILVFDGTLAEEEAAQQTKRRPDTSDSFESEKKDEKAAMYKPVMKRLVHEISIKNQVIYLDPPMEYARAQWYKQLHIWLGIACNLHRIKASRYEMTINITEREVEDNFADLPSNFPSTLSKAYTAVEKKISQVSAYVDKWLQFQSLWDLQAEQVYDVLGNNLSKWLHLLQEIRKTRSTFDTSDVSQVFGHVTIDYEQVQTRVNAKYDSWQHDILMKFAGKLGMRMRDVHAEIEKARRDLESQSLEASSTAQAVTFITIVQQCKKKVKAWGPEMEIFRQGQTTLSRQRYQFPNDWLFVEQIDGEWQALNEILARKSKIVQDQTDALKAKIIAEDRVVTDKITAVVQEWNDEKPVSGTIAPEDASRTLSTFEASLNQLKSESEMVAKAKEALDLPAGPDNILASILEEVQDFKSVWSALSTIWKSLNDLRDTLWSSVVPRKIRQGLDGLIGMTREMPSRMRQYAAFEHIQNVLKTLVSVNTLLVDLKSEAVRERHWAKIFKALKPSQRMYLTSLSLGQVWDLNLKASEVIIKDIVAQAQGEMALEEFVKQVRETWTSYVLDLVNYQNKCRLIRGWDDLFAKCSENLNSLQAMRHSPYYKEFEEEASSWEDKLNRVHVLFDVWIDVQRQWVYLEGVFTGNADIKHLLPIESSRFQNINSEFFAVMKKVYKSPYILDVLNISGVQKSLERLAELLNKIQKALGEYLERERVSFPRFYFVGDEDLLEIIGNSNDTHRIAKHFKKMFAGLSGLLLDEDSTITGFTSKEGEEVKLKKPISLIKTPKINDWLMALENNMKSTLAELLAEAIAEFTPMFEDSALDAETLKTFVDTYPAQIVVLATQTVWTMAVEQSLSDGGDNLAMLHAQEVKVLTLLASTVLGDLNAIMRKKCEHLITEFVHQRDCIQRLIDNNVTSPQHYIWLLQMRYTYKAEGDFLTRLKIKMANAALDYGFEYLGVADRLVRTPLTDRCFLTLTQALCQRLGGSPYGPAGTGKTESVKALGLQLGRFTLVFCCDDTFDFQAMGRIFLGICQVGAWGCFDEFNRLEERILSAVSQQVQNIQQGLKRATEDPESQIELVGRNLKVNQNTGIFITMNPGYAGRSNLPDNLKKLFRSVAMSKPDKELITEVMLYSQGFNQAKALSKQTVPFFDECAKKLSKQAHYDFGLRALKSVLVSSGGLKRARLNDSPDDSSQPGNGLKWEAQIILQSLRETIAPKLIREDVNIMRGIELTSFPGIEYVPGNLKTLEEAVGKIATEQNLLVTDTWMTKVLQLYQIQSIHHGVMMVGESGSGKSSAWKVLLQAMQQVEGVEGVFHIIDPKVMSKEALYGSLDSTTREWTDGLFTSILRKIVDNLRGEDSKRHWVVFDGDVDPEWVENLNSVLDDNKLLTLPNGERLNLPPNVRIMFEVETLKYATLATVSRCGMVWFNNDTVTDEMMVQHYLKSLSSVPFEDLDEDNVTTGQASVKALNVQKHMALLLEQQLLRDKFITTVLKQASNYNHIMQFTEARVLNTLFSLLNKTCRTIIEYNLQHVDFPLEDTQMESFVSKKILLTLVWSLTGDCPLVDRQAFGEFICSRTTIGLPSLSDGGSIIDYDVALPNGDWVSWQNQVPHVEVNTHSVTQTDVVIPTLDTVRHEDVLYSWLAEHKPLLLCGPPGSGKTMTLFSALRKLPNMEVVGLNFSSATTPDLLIKTFEQYCEYRKTLNGVILSPTQIGRWLVIFCDEINLPAPDKYGTQRAISFLRQLVEQNGFWKTSDKTWVTLDRIQFVGACNPPTDAGRTPLGPRFLSHAPLIMVDYPGELSLMQIYGTFNSAVLKIIPSLRGYSEALTKAMVTFYLESQRRFTPKIQPHYVYSPRELTRWVRGVYEALKPLEILSLEGLVRIWAHEALRLFQDRLVAEDERQWTDDSVKRIALDCFPNIDSDKALGGPILFSNWLSKNYVPVDREQLRDFARARLKTFCEEEVDVPLILFNDVLEHVLRIDRVFRQPQGHLILIGVSGSGKTTLSRFVAWMNGLRVFQIKVHGKYSGEDFDEDLRDVLRRCGCKGEKICFIMDEANVLDSGFLERMNTLLANAEVPGLFEGDDFAALMTACKEGAQKQGLLLDSQEELYKWFTQQIVKNLHVVFTMNPPQGGLASKAATSPALFNRCVLNWFGDWSDQAFYQVGTELTHGLDLDRAGFIAPSSIPVAYRGLSLPPSHREAVINAMVYIHSSMHLFNSKLLKQQGKMTFLTPRHFLDFVAQYVKLYKEKREDLEEQQRHLNVGLDKLKDTVEKVSDLRKSLAEKQGQLERKSAEANEKLQRMVADQQETEKKRAESLKVQAALEIQEREVTERKDIVLEDLAQAEPAVIEAQKQLTEVRSMGNPPQGVQLAMESVCSLLGHRVDGWKTIQGIIRREDFIPSIVGFDNEKQMTKSLRAKMQTEYLSRPNFTFENINKASKACGPLVQWVEAQVHYSEILDRVGPLRDEVAELELKAEETKENASAMMEMIRSLEESIARYKEEYAALISETQAIKTEMSKVQFKVDRSVKLLDSLSSERVRWDESSRSFETQIGTLVGDVLLSAAFLAYSGLYDQQFRKSMLEEWMNHLQLSGVEFKQHNPVTGYLSTADERLQWQENSLPVDDLCTENAIILKRFNRYPLIIDPSGRVTDFLANSNKERKLTVTSFLDDSFTKQLESSLRFGNPILIQDAEHLDPILNHVLNKEYQKTGGRVLIQLGRQEIDFSPAFKLYLSTRDPSASFPPDICSRTTFVNFTVTKSSLQTQTLNQVLKFERPDVDQRRSNLMKLQGEFKLHLRKLEKSLLQALNESRGNILDDDRVIDTLETLKREAAEVSKKMAETEGVMNEVEAITQQYEIIAKACSSVFAVLEHLHHLNHFYQFSLQYFLDIFHAVLYGNKHLVAEKDHNARIQIILRDLFITTYQRTSLGLLQKDRVTFAMLLSQASYYAFDRGMIDILLDNNLIGVDVSSEPSRREEALKTASGLPIFQGFVESVAEEDWDKFFDEEKAEDNVPVLWDDKTSELDKSLKRLIIVKLCRLDRLVPAAEAFVAQVFGKEILDATGDLADVVKQVSATTPIALASSPGFDASYKVENLVQQVGANCLNIAMGSSEGLTMADKAVSNAASVGSWVLIKNVHLTPGWLQSLEKRLDALKPHPDFRLFLSMESSPKIPVNSIRASRVLMYEQPAGVRANMRDSLGTLATRKSNQPIEKARVYLLLSFLHAIVQERLRYAPTLGWKGFWEFNDSDYECSAFIIDTWIETVAQNRSNVAPTKLPWSMIRYLVTETYGGKIDNESDFELLRSLVETVFTPAAFETDHKLVDGENPLLVPDGSGIDQFKAWVNELPEREPPTWLGLGANSEKLLLVGYGTRMVGQLGMVTELLEEGDSVGEAAPAA